MYMKPTAWYTTDSPVHLNIIESYTQPGAGYITKYLLAFRNKNFPFSRISSYYFQTVYYDPPTRVHAIMTL